MHVIVATDGSRQSLAAAKHLKSFADPTRLTVGILPFPHGALGSLARRVNPIMNLKNFHAWKGLTIALDRILLEEHLMVLQSAQGANLKFLLAEKQ